MKCDTDTCPMIISAVGKFAIITWPGGKKEERRRKWSKNNTGKISGRIVGVSSSQRITWLGSVPPFLIIIFVLVPQEEADFCSRIRKLSWWPHPWRKLSNHAAGPGFFLDPSTRSMVSIYCGDPSYSPKKKTPQGRLLSLWRCRTGIPWMTDDSQDCYDGDVWVRFPFWLRTMSITCFTLSQSEVSLLPIRGTAAFSGRTPYVTVTALLKNLDSEFKKKNVEIWHQRIRFIF